MDINYIIIIGMLAFAIGFLIGLYVRKTNAKINKNIFLKNGLKNVCKN